MGKKGPSTFQDRLKRIEGQVRGIQKQVDNNVEFNKILIQIEAIISSLESLKIEMVKKEVKDSLLKQLDSVIDLIK